ncbi:conserved hypothetical protein [Thermocrinis albus DSM 14484]|uniref:Uncharacterized protein n=1 Tax=Thermocrinis albus (strain DSM 14484 / JCM 11386 / HI 11/12) TaxID=638303 RepID=D3SLQ3_THEAH|nr:hypothetical protein [Thermocrinis albus]ADC89683.1 conserved hypothetical protein [Thermocrinis albus DSM 14484]
MFLRYIEILLLLLSSVVLAHDVQHTVNWEGKCAVVRFFFPDGTPFSYESYKVFSERSQVPFQIGRTDALGRVVFCPSTPGVWRVSTYSEDGHGARVDIEVKEVGAVEKVSLYERYSKVLTGVSLLIGIWGLYQIYVRRR